MMTQSFDEWYFDAKQHNTDGFTNREFYKAGQQSRQAEIDELKAELETLQGMHNATCLYADELFNERGELQKRIDGAVKCMEQNKPSFPMDFKHAMDALSILKGKQND